MHSDGEGLGSTFVVRLPATLNPHPLASRDPSTSSACSFSGERSRSSSHCNVADHDFDLSGCYEGGAQTCTGEFYSDIIIEEGRMSIGELAASSLEDGETKSEICPSESAIVPLQTQGRSGHSERRLSSKEMYSKLITQDSNKLNLPRNVSLAPRKLPRPLIVDDVESNRKMMCRLLRDRCRDFVQAVNGEEAVNQVRKSLSAGGTSFDVITMDYQMPVMDGPTATRLIRDMGYQGLIVGVTGNALAEDIRVFKSHGANEVMVKPIDIALFDAIIAKYYDK